MQNFAKIKEFLLKNEHRIVLFIGFCLISAISYQFGVMQGQKWQQKPLIIEKPSEVPEKQETPNPSNSEASVASQASSDPKIHPPRVDEQSSSRVEAGKSGASTSQCVYVGSKNSTKFYLPTCSYAKRVKPENLVCFKSAQEALSQGRTESKCN